MENRRIKVVWICHFSNEEICQKLPLHKKNIESASWVPNTLKGFENRDDVEMHIITPSDNLKRFSKLNIRNINYYFVPYGIPLINRHYPAMIPLDAFGNYHKFRTKVKKVVNVIKPDIINLIGAENSNYSSAILDYKDKYPILITIQGFISQLKIEKYYIKTFYRNHIEKRILREFKNFLGENDSKNYISNFNKDFNFYKAFFPVNESLISEIKDEEKKYDCIYFGRLDKIKGTNDFIKVISEIKKIKPDVKGCIVGGGDIEKYKKLAEELNCKQNIEFIGFAKNQKELFRYVKSSKVFLAPPYFERLSATIRESMFLKIPIVAYATGGIPYINEQDENIILVDRGDYKEMANKTSELLNNENLRLSLAEKAYQFAKSEFSVKVNTERMINAYKATIEDFLVRK